MEKKYVTIPVELGSHVYSMAKQQSEQLGLSVNEYLQQIVDEKFMGYVITTIVQKAPITIHMKDGSIYNVKLSPLLKDLQPARKLVFPENTLYTIDGTPVAKQYMIDTHDIEKLEIAEQ